MSKNVIVIGASTSKNSINKELVNYSAEQLNDVELIKVDISNFNNLPIFSVDTEDNNGAPKEIIELNALFKSTDGFIISFAEHNGSYAAGYKNVMDWISRQEGKVFNNKPTLLLSTSPGGRGGATVLGTAVAAYPHFGANVVDSFSLSSFYDNFTDGSLSNKELKSDLFAKIERFQNSL
jgi:chromate reductase